MYDIIFKYLLSWPLIKGCDAGTTRSPNLSAKILILLESSRIYCNSLNALAFILPLTTSVPRCTKRRPPWMYYPWSSLVVGDEGCISPRRKLLCLCSTPKNYATHTWHSSIIVVWLLGQSSCSSLFSNELPGLGGNDCTFSHSSLNWIYDNDEAEIEKSLQDIQQYLKLKEDGDQTSRSVKFLCSNQTFDWFNFKMVLIGSTAMAFSMLSGESFLP